MFGNVDVKTRPLRLAYLVDPNDVKGIREAIRLSSTLWGGATFPIIQLYQLSPRKWREKPFRPPTARSVVLGYLEAFDPDVLVQRSRRLPASQRLAESIGKRSAPSILSLFSLAQSCSISRVHRTVGTSRLKRNTTASQGY